MKHPDQTFVVDGVTVVDDAVIDWAGSPSPSPTWVRNSAAVWARAQGRTAVRVTEYFETPEYRRQVERNLKSVARIEAADIAATVGNLAPDRPDRTPYQKGDDQP